MPLPTIAFGILLSSFYGALYHFIRGGPAKKFLFFLALSWIGFWLGDSLGSYQGWWFAQIGVLNAGMGTVFSLVFMMIGDVFSNIVGIAKETR